MATESQVVEESPTKIIVSGTNGEVLQEDPSDQNLISNPQKDGHTSPAGAEQNGPQNATQDEETISKPDASPLSIDEYLEKHKINVIFEELIFRTIDKTPENPLKFLHSNLEKMEQENWQPGESFSEKADAVKKIFKPQPKDPETDKPGIGRGRQGSAKGGKTGTITGRNIGTKTVTPAKANPPRVTGSTVKPTPARAAVPPKTGAGVRPATTPARVTTKTATAAPPKTATAAPPKTTTTAAPPKIAATAGAKTGATARTTSNTGPSRQPVKPVATRPVPTAAKTGSNNSLAKGPVKPPVKATSTPARAGAKTSGAGVRGAAAPKTTGRAVSGPRPTGAKTGAPGATPRTTAGKIGPGGKKEIPAKDEIPETEPEPEPEPKVETPPAEEAKAPTPEPPQKPPGDDGMFSQIPGSEEATGPVPDSDEQLANQEIRYDSGDEPPTLPSNRDTDTHTSPLVDTGIDIPAEKPDTVKQEDRLVTSEDNARELQGIEDGAELDVRRRTEMSDLADEGIDVDPDALFTPRMDTGNEKLYSSDEPSLVPPGIPAVPGSSSDSEAGKKEEKIVELELGSSDSPLVQDSEQTPHSPVLEETQLIGVDDVTTKSPPKPGSPELPPVQISIEKTFQNATHSPSNQSPTEFYEKLIPSPTNQSPTDPAEKVISSPTNQSPTEQAEKLIPSPTNQSPTDPAEKLISSPSNQSPTEPAEKLISSPSNQSPTESAEKLISSPTNQSPTEQAEKLISSPSNQSPTEPAEKLIAVPSNQSSDPTADQANDPPQSTIDLFESQMNTNSSPTTQPPTNPFETGLDSNYQSTSIDD